MAVNNILTKDDYVRLNRAYRDIVKKSNEKPVYVISSIVADIMARLSLLADRELEEAKANNKKPEEFSNTYIKGTNMLLNALKLHVEVWSKLHASGEDITIIGKDSGIEADFRGMIENKDKKVNIQEQKSDNDNKKETIIEKDKFTDDLPKTTNLVETSENSENSIKDGNH